MVLGKRDINESGREKLPRHLRHHKMLFRSAYTYHILKKEMKIPPAITASLAEHKIESVLEHISLTPPAFRLFTDGSEIIHHQQNFQNSPFSGERKKCLSTGLETKQLDD